jgi:phenylpropionate dioxygenase-like ring-hydroxylating dioxygenase large terminal subunit
MNAKNPIFDPRQYEHVRRELAHASHLPPWCYTSEEFFRAEMEHVFMHHWNFVGRGDALTKPGHYFTREIAGVPIIVLRGRDGALHAFLNSCRHRGSRLLSGEGASGGTISCPYHAWVYGLDGKLLAAQMMDGIAGFHLSDYPLRRVRLDIWDGFVFVNFDDEAPGLAEYLGDLPRRMASYDFPAMVTVRRKAYDVACNWKLLTENSMEEYHTATVHRGSIGAQVLTFEEGPGEWEAGHLLADKSAATLPGETAGFPHIATLHGKPAEGTYFVLVYPCTTFAFFQDALMWLELYPQSAARTRVVVGSAFPRATVERPDFETVVQVYYKRWDKSIPEDNWISEQQQLGLSSPLSLTGRVSRFEPVVHKFANWILNRVLPKNA